jgi:hypothetical protein
VVGHIHGLDGHALRQVWHVLLLDLLTGLGCQGLILHLFLLLVFDFLLVSLQVAVQVELGEEPSLAELASKPLVAIVDLHVLVQVRLLSKSVVAIRERALVWPLLGVDAQVVEEVVPLPEHLSALAMSARQKSDDSPSLWALVFKYYKVFRRRNMLFDAYLIQVEFFSFENG